MECKLHASKDSYNSYTSISSVFLPYKTLSFSLVVELFSKLRLNILLLAIDLTTEENEIANIINHDGKLSTSTGTSSNSNFGNTSSHNHSAVTPSKKNPSNSNSMTNTEV